MPKQNSDLRQRIQRQYLRIQSLQRLSHTRSDPAGTAELLKELAAADGEMRSLEQQVAQAESQPEEAVRGGAGGEEVLRGGAGGEEVLRGGAGGEEAVRGGYLGQDTAGLKVETTLLMQPLPTGMYHLLNPDTEPLLRVTLKVGPDALKKKRVCVKAYLEGLSAQVVRTLEIEPGEGPPPLNLLPTLFPDRARAITEIQRATLHVLVEDLDARLERHDTYSVVCLARNSGFNTVRRPDQPGKVLDLTHYYGAWVTPHAEEVQRLVQRASQLLPSREMRGYYQASPDQVREQVKALFQALKEKGLTYVNATIDYGAPEGVTTQRTRLPRESLAAGSANCLDGAVLMASLLEGAALEPALVLIPGHAFVGWHTGIDEDEASQWRFLETTMIADAEFEAACQKAQSFYDEHRQYYADRLKLHRLSALRARGVWPME